LYGTSLGAFSADSASELDVLRHDGDTLSVDGAQVGVFEETHQVGLGCFLKGTNRGALESQISLEILSDFAHQSLEGQFSDEQFGRFLVSSNFSQGDGSGSVAVGLLDASGARRRFSRSLGGELLSGSFSSGGLSCSLFGSCHFSVTSFSKSLVARRNR
jgi:hypothetical protein